MTCTGGMCTRTRPALLWEPWLPVRSHLSRRCMPLSVLVRRRLSQQRAVWCAEWCLQALVSTRWWLSQWRGLWQPHVRHRLPQRQHLPWGQGLCQQQVHWLVAIAPVKQYFLCYTFYPDIWLLSIEKFIWCKIWFCQPVLLTIFCGHYCYFSYVSFYHIRAVLVLYMHVILHVL